MSRGDSAGRGPQAKRGASRDVRSRAPLPSKLSPRSEPPAPKQSATLTARAAILVVAVATVIVAVALPFKIWLSQRQSIDSLAQENAAIQHRVQQLQRQDQRWQKPSYIERQANRRLHMVLPGHKTYVKLGTGKHRTTATNAPTGSIVADGPWYSELWGSMQVSGGVVSSKQ